MSAQRSGINVTAQLMSSIAKSDYTPCSAKSSLFAPRRFLEPCQRIHFRDYLRSWSSPLEIAEVWVEADCTGPVTADDFLNLVQSLRDLSFASRQGNVMKATRSTVGQVFRTAGGPVLYGRCCWLVSLGDVFSCAQTKSQPFAASGEEIRNLKAGTCF